MSAKEIIGCVELENIMERLKEHTANLDQTLNELDRYNTSAISNPHPSLRDYCSFVNNRDEDPEVALIDVSENYIKEMKLKSEKKVAGERSAPMEKLESIEREIEEAKIKKDFEKLCKLTDTLLEIIRNNCFEGIKNQ